MTCNEARSVPARCLSATAMELLGSVRHIKGCKSCQKWLAKLEGLMEDVAPGAVNSPVARIGAAGLAVKCAKHILNDPEAT